MFLEGDWISINRYMSPWSAHTRPFLGDLVDKLMSKQYDFIEVSKIEVSKI